MSSGGPPLRDTAMASPHRDDSTRATSLKKRLHTLGYFDMFEESSLELIEKLLNELVKTKASLHSMALDDSRPSLGLQELAQQVQPLQEENARLQDQLSSVQINGTHLQASLVQASAQAEVLKSERDSLERQLDECRLKLRANQEGNSVLRGAEEARELARAAHRDAEQFHSQAAALRREALDYQAQVNNMESNIVASRKLYTQKIISAEHQARGAERDIQFALSEAESFRREARECRDVVMATEQKSARLQEEVTNQQLQLRSARADAQEVEQRCKQLQEVLEAKEKLIHRVYSELTHHTRDMSEKQLVVGTRFSSLSGGMEAARLEDQQVCEAVATAIAELAVARTEVASRRIDEVSAAARADSLQLQLSGATNESMQHAARLREEAGRREMVEAELSQLSVTTNAAREEKSRLERQLSEYQQDVTKRGTELHRLELLASERAELVSAQRSELSEARAEALRAKERSEVAERAITQAYAVRSDAEAEVHRMRMECEAQLSRRQSDCESDVRLTRAECDNEIKLAKAERDNEVKRIQATCAVEVKQARADLDNQAVRLHAECDRKIATCKTEMEAQVTRLKEQLLARSLSKDSDIQAMQTALATTKESAAEKASRLVEVEYHVDKLTADLAARERDRESVVNEVSMLREELMRGQGERAVLLDRAEMACAESGMFASELNVAREEILSIRDVAQRDVAAQLAEQQESAEAQAEALRLELTSSEETCKNLGVENGGLKAMLELANSDVQRLQKDLDKAEDRQQQLDDIASTIVGHTQRMYVPSGDASSPTPRSGSSPSRFRSTPGKNIGNVDVSSPTSMAGFSTPGAELPKSPRVSPAPSASTVAFLSAARPKTKSMKFGDVVTELMNNLQS
ncbi:hypothetical protein CYMTET_4226 [Cymbomonas tetramitiformis]|uniref:Uncharacterized protein n=1 Tax=Cymbomonas tetramitiformis TaxID=36881 RepID=A0AAE0H1L4_9CHLO|nr:hypothetical protein CYMTET_4226 [Cymbomonas tetramitiformis]